MKYINKGLVIERVNVKDLANKFGTPTYCYSFNKLKFVLRDIVSKVIMSFIDITKINKIFYEGSDIRFDNILKKYNSLINLCFKN